MIFRGLCILASCLVVGSSLNKDEEPSTGVQRQFIGSQGFGQNPFSRAPPFSMPSNGMNPIGRMNDPQPNANQLQLLAAMQKDPRMRQQMSGFLQQMEGGGGGIGQPMGENGFRNEESTLMQNPITAPDGLTKDVLKSLMLGNVGEVSPPYGNRMGFPSNDMMNSFSNGPSSPPDGPRKLGSLVNSFTNRQAGSEGFPVFPKFNFGGQEQSQEEAVLHARHHHRHGHSKKGKSDTVTKLLLSLLVDKLKDIYEMDKFNTSTFARKHNLQNLETTGKIGNDLHSAGDQGNVNQVHEAADQRKGTFQTNLTFPLTVSDQKSTDVQLIDSGKKGAKADNKSNFEVDSASIDKIIKGIEANQTLKLNPARSKPVDKTGVNRELKESYNVDAVSSLTTSGLETAEKSTKVLGNEDFITNPDTGSFAEFHTIKMPLKSSNQNESVSSPDEELVKAEDIKTMVPLDGNGVENITSLPSFSVSSFLNRDRSQGVTATDRVLAPNLQSSQGISSSAELESAPNDLSSKLVDNPSEPRTPGSDNYLEASRVLGSVYKKVTDPLAKKSVETAIKAMLKLIRSDSAYSKKGYVPSLGTDYQSGEPGLERSFSAFVEGQDGAVKKARKVKVEIFPLKTIIRKKEPRVRKKIITRFKLKESRSKQLKKFRKGRICKCKRELVRILKRKGKSVNKFNKRNSKLKL